MGPWLMAICGCVSVAAVVLPVAVTRHGQTVGFFVPTARPAQADLQALREAADKLEAVVPLTDDQLESSGRWPRWAAGWWGGLACGKLGRL